MTSGSLIAAAVRKRLAGARKVVTIDMDSAAVRLLEVRGRKVTRWASLSLEPGDVEDGVVLNPKSLSSRVKQLIASSSITGGQVVASVGGLYSMSRILTVPNGPGGAAATAEAVLEAAKSAMPVDTDKLYLSWQVIAAGEREQLALVVGVPREVIDTQMPALRAAGLGPQALDFKAIALARAVNRERALILNIEPSSLDIILVVNGAPEIIRTVAWRQDNLTTDDRAEQLGGTLELTTNFFNTRHPTTPLDGTMPLFVTGQMSADPVLLEKLQARSGYPLEPLAPPLEYSPQLPVSQYAVNIGLALKGETLPGPGQAGYALPDINMLPPAYHPWKPSARQVYGFVSIVAAIVLLAFLYQFTGGAMARTGELQKRFNTLNIELQRRQVEIKNRVPLQKAVDEYRAILDMDSGVTEEIKVLVEQAGKLGIAVESIRHSGAKIALTVKSPDFATFRTYLGALAKTGKFASITPPQETYPSVTTGTAELVPKAKR